MEEKFNASIQTKKMKKLLVEIDCLADITKIFPTNTIETSPNFFTQKYDTDISFVFEKYGVSVVKNKDNDDVIIRSFLKTIHYC